MKSIFDRVTSLQISRVIEAHMVPYRSAKSSGLFRPAVKTATSIRVFASPSRGTSRRSHSVLARGEFANFGCHSAVKHKTQLED